MTAGATEHPPEDRDLYAIFTTVRVVKTASRVISSPIGNGPPRTDIPSPAWMRPKVL